jgi:eukaryotic-like serine/threonine-protein kinase
MAATGSVAAGTRVGRYEIVSLLRQGGMGEVYSAEDHNLGRRVALKILPRHRTSDPERVARFVREVRASSTLNHPAIVSVHDAGSEGDVHFLAMELIDGLPLSEWMRRRRSIEGRAEIMAQVADGLAKAHDAGIVHRDLKPDNIMVTAESRAKIVDFGVAKLTERLGNAPVTGVSTPTSRVGTTAYMSPEQIDGKPLDHRTDVFSFGVVLYELLTGVNPFTAPHYADTIHNVVHLAPPMDRVPGGLRRVVQRCLQKEPELRYDSLRDAALDLREAANVTAPPRGRRKLAVLLAIAVSIAAAGAAWWLVRHRAADGKVEPRGMTMTRLTHSGKVTTAAISPDGKYVVHAVTEGDRQALYVKQIATGVVTRIADPAPVYYFDVSLSPDGNYLYYAAAARIDPNLANIEQLPLLGGTPRRIASDTEFRFSVSPDGTQIAFCRFNALSREYRITTAAVDGSGERVVVHRKQPEFLSAPVWTPDGSALTFAAGSARTDKGALYQIRLASGKIEPVAMPEFHGIGSYQWLSDGSGALMTVYAREQPPQIWFVPTGAREGKKITSEVSGYHDIVLTADSSSFSAVREVIDSNIYTLALDGKRGEEPHALTSGYGNWLGGNGVLWLNDDEVIVSSLADGTSNYSIVPTNGATPRRFIQSMRAWALTVSPDRLHIAFVSDKSGANEIWIADVTGANARQLTTRGTAGWPAFTPDGRAIVYVRSEEGQRVWRIPIDGSTAPVRITDAPANRPYVSPDGKWLLCRLRSTDASSPLWRTAILPLQGNAPPRYFDAPRSGGPPTLQWHPNGRAFLYVDYRNGVANLWMQDIDGGPPRQMTFLESGEIFSFDVSPDGKRLLLARGEQTSDAVLIRDFR